LIKIEWNTLIKIWQNKLRHLRCFLHGWVKNRGGVYKKEKHKFIAIIDELDIKAKTIPLGASKRYALLDANDHLLNLRREEENNGIGEQRLNMCKKEKIIRNIGTLLQMENIEK
jgi:hypothetical protein